MANWHLMARALVLRPIMTMNRADAFMRAAVDAAQMNIIGGPWSVFGEIPGNEGVSSTAILDFSSTNLHEWIYHSPHPLIHFDLFTCGTRPSEDKFRELFRELIPVTFDVKVIDRDEFLR